MTQRKEIEEVAVFEEVTSEEQLSQVSGAATPQYTACWTPGNDTEWDNEKLY